MLGFGFRRTWFKHRTKSIFCVHLIRGVDFVVSCCIPTAQVQIEGDFLPCSFSILEDQPMDMLLGLDMLKRHQVRNQDAPFCDKSFFSLKWTGNVYACLSAYHLSCLFLFLAVYNRPKEECATNRHHRHRNPLPVWGRAARVCPTGIRSRGAWWHPSWRVGRQRAGRGAPEVHTGQR